MRRRDEHRVDGTAPARPRARERVEIVDAGPLLVDRQRHERRPVRSEDRPVRQAGVLHRHARACQRARQQHEALGRARADDDRLGIGDHPAHAPQVLGKSPSQLSRTARIRIAEGSIGRLADRLANGAQPRPARERRRDRDSRGRSRTSAPAARARPRARPRRSRRRRRTCRLPGVRLDSPRRAAARRRRPPAALRPGGPMPARGWPGVGPPRAGDRSGRPLEGRPRAASEAAGGSRGRARRAAPGRNWFPFLYSKWSFTGLHYQHIVGAA